MSQSIPIAKVIEASERYETLASRLGFQVDKAALQRYALNGHAPKGRKAKNLLEHADPGASAPAEAVKAIQELTGDLADVVRRAANGGFPKGVRKCTCEFLDAVASLPPGERADVAESVSRSRHKDFLAPGEIPVERFQELLAGYAKGQTIARGRLVKHLQEEARKRGVEMSRDAIEERMRSNTKVRTAPACFADIVAGLDESFLTGLIPVEELVGDAPPADWLEDCLRMLGLRSHNAMHKAVAQATGLNYEAVHKALTRPRPGQRIQISIKRTLDDWLEKAKRGERPVAAYVPARRSSPGRPSESARLRRLLKRLLRSFPGPEALHEAAAQALGVSPAEVPDFMERKGAPLRPTPEQLAAVKQLDQNRRRKSYRISYLASAGTRRLADRLTQDTNAVYRAWASDPENATLRRAFRKMRLELIVAMKHRWTVADWREAHQETGGPTVELAEEEGNNDMDDDYDEDAF